MSFFKQSLLGLVVVAITLALWIYYVPSAAPLLDRLGVYSALGIEPAKPEEKAGRAGGFGGGGPVQVIVAEVTEAELSDRITAIGDGRSVRSVTVRSEAAGRIEAVEFPAGSYVEENAVFLRLDDEAERIAVERARLVLADAKAELNRITQLEGTGTVPAVRFQEAELVLRTAELERQQAEFNLAQRVIRAPVSGWIGLLDIEVGSRVGAQDALALITDRSQILIDFRVPERVTGQLSIGTPIEVTSLAQPDRVMAGKISAIDNIVDRNSRTLRVQGIVENDGDRLRSGMAFSVALSFPGNRYPQVDALALQWSSAGSYVWVVRDGKAARVPVVIQQRNSDTLLVEADLVPGDLVVTEGVQSLKPGAEVRVAAPGTTFGTQIDPARGAPAKL